MKHLYIILSLAVILLAGCAVNKDTARVEVSMSPSHLAVAETASGSMPLVEWQDFSVRQEKGNAEIVLWRKAKDAAGQGDLASAREYAEAAQDLACQYTLCKLVNPTCYKVTVLDGPYSGLVLNPGQETAYKKVPIGELNFKVVAAETTHRDYEFPRIYECSVRRLILPGVKQISLTPPMRR